MLVLFTDKNDNTIAVDTMSIYKVTQSSTNFVEIETSNDTVREILIVRGSVKHIANLVNDLIKSEITGE